MSVANHKRSSDQPHAASHASLRDRTRHAQRRQKQLAGALVAVALLGALGVYRPAQRAVAATHEQMVELNARREADQSRASALPALQVAVDELRRQVDKFKPLRGPSDIQQAFAQITQIKNETALASYNFSTNDAPRTLGTCLEQRVRITFQAEFVDAMSFVQKIEAMDRLTRVRELKITGHKPDTAALGETNRGRVGVEMALSLFFRVGDDVQVAAKGGAR